MHLIFMFLNGVCMSTTAEKMEPVMLLMNVPKMGAKLVAHVPEVMEYVVYVRTK